jgi:hypothetical protein
VTTVDLRACEALQCKSMMCAKFGGACVCKLSKVLEQTAPRLTQLTTVVLADNDLTLVPESLWGIASLQTLDLSGNVLEDVPVGIETLPDLRTLDLRSNRIVGESAPRLAMLPPSLMTLHLGGNPTPVDDLRLRCDCGGASTLDVVS